MPAPERSWSLCGWGDWGRIETFDFQSRKFRSDPGLTPSAQAVNAVAPRPSCIRTTVPIVSQVWISHPSRNWRSLCTAPVSSNLWRSPAPLATAVCSLARAAETRMLPLTPTIWEYRMAHFAENSEEQTVAMLNRLGAEGWELVSWTAGSNRQPPSAIGVFKRRVACLDSECLRVCARHCPGREARRNRFVRLGLVG